MKKKKKQARIRNSIILAVLVVAAFVGLKLASSDKYAQTRTDVLEKYLSYTDTDAVTYEDYLESTNGDYISDSAEEITVKAADYKTAEMDDLKKDGEIVWTAGEGTITYEFDVKEAGWYNVRLTYYTDTDSTQNIVRNIRVNDTRLFDGCDGVTFSRLWMDDNKDWLMNTDGNQAHQQMWTALVHIDTKKKKERTQSALSLYRQSLELAKSHLFRQKRL